MKKCFCDREKIDKLLDRRPIQWLVDKLNENGIEIKYRGLVSLLLNNNEWKATYVLGICEIFNVKVEELFYLNEQPK